MSQFDLEPHHQVIWDPEHGLRPRTPTELKPGMSGLIDTSYVDLVHMAIRTVIINGQLGQIGY